MSKTIDEKVVSMKFDNSHFEKNVQTTLSTLDKLKQKLNLEGAVKSFENIGNAANKVDMSGLNNGVETLRARFSALDVVAVTALANITNSAINAGRRMISALTIQPLKDGFQEYETQINSVQTIMANTGKDVKTVNKALDELNEYADLTIYNFATMTQNAGMFTAAGVSLEDTMIALKGSGNWAAYAGANTQQMGNATYQLGQALSAGAIRLQDWMSVEKAAGMGGEKYRQAFMETAKQHGINVDAMIKKNGSFRESLREGWLTTDIFIETMQRFANDKGMTDAATKVKTFTQLIDTLKEALGTGWATTWRIIVGDFEEAKELFTGISDFLSGIINKSSDARNALLKGALGSKEDGGLGGRALLLESFSNLLQPLIKILEAVGKAWRNAFPTMKPEQLYGMIKGFNEFTKSLVMSEKTVNNLTRTLKGVFAVFDMITSVVGGGFKIAFKIGTAVIKGFAKVLGFTGDSILESTANIGDVIGAVRKWFEEHSLIKKVIEVTVPLIIKFAKAIADLVKAIYKLPAVQNAIEGIQNGLENFAKIGENIIEGIANGLEDGITSLPDILTEIGKKLIAASKDVLGIHSPSQVMFDIGLNIIQGLINGIVFAATSLINGAKEIVSNLQNVFSSIDIDLSGHANALSTAFTKLKETFSGIDFSKVFAGGLSIGMIAVVKKLADAFEALASPVKGLGDLFSGAGKVLDKSAKGIYKVLKSFSKVLNSFAFSIKAKALKNVVISLGILVVALIALTFIDTDKLWNAVDVLGVTAAILVGLAVAIDKLSNASASIDKKGINLSGLKTGLLAIAGSLLMMALAVKLMGSMDQEQAKQGFVGLAGLVIAIGAVFAAYGTLVKGKAAQNMDKAGKMIKKMATSLLLMVVVVKLVGMLSLEEISKGIIFMAGFTAFVLALVAVTKTAGRNIDKVGSMILKISLSLGLMVGVIKLVGMLSVGEILKGAAFMAGFIVFVGLLVGVAKAAGKDLPKIGGTLLAVSSAMLIMAGTVKLISGMSWGDLIKGGIGITAFAGIMYLLLEMIKKIGPEAPKLAATLLAMSISIGILAGVAVMLSLIDWGGLMKGVAAVAILGGVMTAMIWATRGANDVKGNLIVMTVAIGVMAAAVAALSMIEPSRLAGSTIALGMLMGIFAIMEKSASSMKGSMASLIIMTAVVGALARIIYLLSGLPADSVVAVSASLSLLLLSLAASMQILSMAAPIMPSALISVGILTVVVGILGRILYLMRDMDASSTLVIASSLSLLLMSLSTSCLILAGVGALGTAAFIGIGALITLIGSMGTLMIAIGALTTYFPALEEFLNKGITILQQIGYGIGSFVGNMINGVLTEASQSLPNLANSLSDFMENLQPFIEGARGIDASVAEGVKSLAQAILILTAADILEGITSWLTGGSSLGDFAEQLEPFGKGLKGFADAVTGIDGESVTSAVNAAKSLAEMTKALPNEGGLVSLFAGDNNMTKFAENLEPFGEGLKGYSDAVTGIDAKSIEASVTAAKALTELADSIPNEGGFVSLFTGDNDMTSFAENLEPFGEGLKNYSDTVSGIDASAISNSVSIVKDLINTLKSMKDVDTDGVYAFKDAIDALAETNISGISEAFKESTPDLSNIGADIINSISKGMASKKSTLSKNVITILNDMIKILESKKSAFNLSGVKLMNGLILGFNKNSSKIKSTLSAILKSASSTIRSYYTKFYNAGYYVVSGFANGISANSYMAAAKAKVMAQNAADAAKKELKEHSPSKVFYGIGNFAGVAFVNALSDYASVSYKAGSDMGESARTGLSDAISKISNTINSNMDMQPTISPVLDLSNVTSGARKINSIFGDSPSIGVMSNVKAISSMMAQRNQNGVNDDVVSAINSLKKVVGNSSGNSYTINGITYDSGTEVADAIEALVRAAKIERRV